MSGAALLTQLFREKTSKLKDSSRHEEGQMSVGYSTGFLSFDFMNGCKVFGKRDDQRFQYYSLGVRDGSMIMVIGRSGCGKTTWIVQTASNIIKSFKTACIFHDDIEGGVNDTRRIELTKFVDGTIKDRYIYRNSGITGESFYERIKMIHDLKVENRSDFEYDTGLYDEYGDRIFKLEPTVYILDSLSMLMSETYADEDELSGQMAATATARMNASIFKRVIPLMKRANIILFVVNHINEKVELNQFARTKAAVSYLKAGETLPGGKVPVYVSDNLIRFDDASKLKPEEAFGIAGSLVEVSLIKSRVNRAGTSCTLVFDQMHGFDNELSSFILLKQHGRINGAGVGLYLADRNDMKFSQKNFKKKMHDNPELKELFENEVLDVLTSLIPDLEEVSWEEDYGYALTQSVLDKLNNMCMPNSSAT